MTTAPTTPAPKLKPGAIVRCRTRRYLVEDVQPPMHRKVPEGGDRVVTLACMEDDAIGQRLTVFLGSEVDFEPLAESSWEDIAIDAFRNAWSTEVAEARSSHKRERLYLATGLLLPVWDKLPSDFVRVSRISAADGRSRLGRLGAAAPAIEDGQRQDRSRHRTEQEAARRPQPQHQQHGQVGGQVAVSLLLASVYLHPGFQVGRQDACGLEIGYRLFK